MREGTRDPNGLDAVTGSLAKRRDSFLRGRVSPLRPEVIFQRARVPMSQIYLLQKLPRLSGEFPLLLGLKSLPELPPGALIAAIHPENSRKLFMPRSPKAKSAPKDSSASLGFESRVCGICLAADKLRNNMDAAEPSGARQTAHGSASNTSPPMSSGCRRKPAGLHPATAGPTAPNPAPRHPARHGAAEAAEWRVINRNSSPRSV